MQLVQGLTIATEGNSCALLTMCLHHLLKNSLQRINPGIHPKETKGFLICIRLFSNFKAIILIGISIKETKL